VQQRLTDAELGVMQGRIVGRNIVAMTVQERFGPRDALGVVTRNVMATKERQVEQEGAYENRRESPKCGSLVQDAQRAPAAPPRSVLR
jgi:hypothetical protein